MNDSSKPQQEPDALKESLNALHPTKPSENIAILKTNIQSSEKSLEKLHETQSFGKVQSEYEVESNQAKIEENKNSNDKLPELNATEAEEKQTTLQESRDPIQLKAQSDEIPKAQQESPTSVSLDKKPRVSSAIGLNHGERITRNQSDIFSLKEQTSIASSIFSINGSPSRKLYRKKELASNNVFPTERFCKEDLPSERCSPRDRLRESQDSYNDLKRPSSSIRNPLTGTGLSSNDEYKFKGAKRKDGNPLLGLGYSPEATPSAHKIPPGGFSHKLW